MELEPKPIVAGKTEPVQVKFVNTNNTIHDIDLHAFGPLNYNFEGPVPTNFNGDTLALMFPRGFQLTTLNGYTAGVINQPNTEFVKKWYFVWQQFQQILDAIMTMSKWDNLPKEIKWYNLENLKLRNGQVAFCKYYGKYFVSSFSKNETDIYDEPNEITLSCDNTKLDKLTLKSDKFVIIKDNVNGTPLYNTIIMYIEQLFQIQQQIYINLFASAPKGVFIRSSYSDGNGGIKKMELALNDVSQGTKTFYTLDVGQDIKGDIKLQREIFIDKGKTPLYIPIELNDRSESLITQFNMVFNQLKERCGLSQDLTFDKKERLVASEIGARNNMSELLKQNRFLLCKDAVDEINKKFNLNIKYEMNEIESDENKTDRKDGNDYAINK